MSPRQSTRARIQKATPRDAEQLTAAHAAKRHWGYPEQWIRLWQRDLTLTPTFIRTHLVYCAVRDREILGFYALSCRADEFELEHMWIHPDHIGAGLGRRLFSHALAAVCARRGRILKIASDPNAEEFYRSLGARRVGEVRSLPAGRRLPLLIVDLRRDSRRPATALERSPR